jgi:Met-zincin
MDYPHPLEKLNADGAIDLSEAYQARIGDWDKVTINYGYRQFAPGTDEKAALTKILDDAWAQDLRYMTNQDTDSNPKVDQWSNGVDQADELLRLLKVRRSALSRIGEHTIRAGAPLATIEEPLVPIFMYHRYAVESTASMVAGQDYIYGMRGDSRTPTKGVSVDDQRKALDALAMTLRPAELTVPKRVVDLIPPRPPGFGMHRELFPRTTGDTFDPLSPATVAADVTIGFVLQFDRAARMVAQHAVNPAAPGLEDVIDRLTTATFDAPTTNGYEAAVRRAEERVLVDRIMWLAVASPNSQVRAIASLKLSKLAARLRTAVARTEADTAQRTLIAADIKRFIERPLDPARPIPLPAPDAPPGAPIGDWDQDWLAPPPAYGGSHPFSWEYWIERPPM